MSETSPAPAPVPGPSSGGPPRPFRPFGGNRPPRDKPAPRQGKPPVIDEMPFGGAAPKLRDLDAAIEAELAAALEGMDQKSLMPEDTRDRTAPKPLLGAETPKKKGKVMSIHHADVFIDVPGGRSQGVMPLEQFEDGPPAIGTEVEFDIERYDPANGLLILTRRGSVQSVDWSSVATGMVVEAVVTGTTKGGLAVSVNGIRGFMPISQIDMYRVEQPEQFINQRLKCAVTEVDPADRNLVVSRRALLEREREEQKAKLWAEIEVGQVRTGIVRNIREFGIFVDLGGADGLVPIGEMSWARVADASQLVSSGQSVQVKVTKIDFEARKIGLSLRQLSASPWDNAPNRLYVGSRTKGKVTRIADFGAFVELEPGVEGLIHISELSPQRVRRVRDVVTEGQEVDVLVLSIDTASRRISLSLKAAQAQGPDDTEADDDTPATPAEPPKPRMYKLKGGVD